MPKKTDKKSITAANKASKSNDLSEAAKLSTELKPDNFKKLLQNMDNISDEFNIQRMLIIPKLMSSCSYFRY